MKYSVVICSYNKLESLKLVAGALKATGVEYELVLSDDGSTDRTVEWARESDLFTRVIEGDRSDEYRLCTVRNSGIEAASGRYIILLDADCVPNSDYFSGHDLAFDTYPNCISVGFTIPYDSSGTKKIANDQRQIWAKKAGTDICACGWMAAYGGNISFPKKLWEELGGFDERYNGAWGLEDADFAYMAHKKNVTIVTSSKTVARHLAHPRTGTAEMHSGKGPNTKKFKDKHGFYPC